MAIQLTIDKRGRIIIPKPLREALKLQPGDRLELETCGEQLTLLPVRKTGPLTKEKRVWVLRTREALPQSVTDEMLQKIREERDVVNLGRGA